MTLPAWAPPGELKPAPEPLLLVQAFVNTRDRSLGTDLLADADAASQWLRQCGLLAAEATADADDPRAARDVREGLREPESAPRPPAAADRLAVPPERGHRPGSAGGGIDRAAAAFPA